MGISSGWEERKKGKEKNRNGEWGNGEREKGEKEGGFLVESRQEELSTVLCLVFLLACQPAGGGSPY